MKNILYLTTLLLLSSCSSTLTPSKESNKEDTFNQKETYREQIKHKTYSRSYTEEKSNKPKRKQVVRIGVSSNVKKDLKSNKELEKLHVEILENIHPKSKVKCIRLSKIPFKEFGSVYTIDTYRKIGQGKNDCYETHGNKFVEIPSSSSPDLIRRSLVSELISII